MNNKDKRFYSENSSVIDNLDSWHDVDWISEQGDRDTFGQDCQDYTIQMLGRIQGSDDWVTGTATFIEHEEGFYLDEVTDIKEYSI